MRRAIAVFVMVSLTGCSTWRPISKEQLPSTITKREPGRIRLTRTDSVLDMRHPTLRGDTLFGFTKTPTGRTAVAVPLSNVESGAVRQGNGKTATIVAVTALFVSLMAINLRGPNIKY
jgi:hypothetical protein